MPLTWNIREHSLGRTYLYRIGEDLDAPGTIRDGRYKHFTIASLTSLLKLGRKRKRESIG